MAAVTKFFSSVLSVLIIAGMFMGIYNPCVAPFRPPEPAEFADPPAYTGETLTLIEDGRSDYVIVVGAGAIPAELTAAEKLQGYLKRVGGAELPIVTDAAAPQAAELVVGNTNRYAFDAAPAGKRPLGADGFIVRTVESRIVFAGGGPRGTLYSVFDFLEKFLGCRWFSIEMTIVPERATVVVPAEIDEYEAPCFTYRQPTTVNALTYTDVDCALANRVNAQGMIGNATNDEKYGGIVSYPVTHSADEILPPGKYLEEHPDYYAHEEDGTVIYINGYNPCLSNPAVKQIYIDFALDKMAKNPALQGISMGLNDSGAICRCAGCQALYALESNDGAGQTGALMRVLNAVCEALEAAGHTEVTVNAFAYGTATYPPDIDLHPQIVIHFCPINMCYVHGPGECDYWENLYYFDEVLQGWGKIAKKICVFEYPLSYNQPGAVYPIWEYIQSYMQFYYENNVIGLSQCVCTVHDINFYVLTGYMYARLLWNPYLDMEALYADFLSGYYGGGWQYIREYIRFASLEGSGRTIGGVTYHTNSLNGDSQIAALCLTKNEVRYCNELWAKAKELSGGGAYLDNVRRAELSWRMWKSDTFRDEFWPLNLTFSRTRSNMALYDDFAEFGILYHNTVDWWVQPEDFYKLKLYLLYPRMWSWRQLGMGNEGNVDSLLELLWKSIF